MYRLIYGAKLENELKCGEKQDAEATILFNEWEQRSMSSVTPFIVFKYHEGQGWKPRDYNDKGWELYGESIMGNSAQE